MRFPSLESHLLDIMRTSNDPHDQLKGMVNYNTVLQQCKLLCRITYGLCSDRLTEQNHFNECISLIEHTFAS